VVLAGEELVFLPDLADVERVAQEPVDRVLVPPAAADPLAGLRGVALLRVAKRVELLGDGADRARLQVQIER
jgi:hypothetical protein